MKKFNYIYLIRNLINNKIYVGKHSTDNLCDGYMGSGKLLKHSIKKYGIENFKKTLLCLCDEDDLNEMEKLYIKVYGSNDKTIGYNLTFGGDGGRPTDEVIQKMRENNLGEKNPMYGKHFSDESKQKISEANKGKHHSEEHIAKISESLKGNHNFKGKQHSNKTRRKISESKRGTHHSEKTKAKISASKKGVPSPKKGKQAKKFKWLTTEGEIVEMDKSNARRYHQDWQLITE